MEEIQITEETKIYLTENSKSFLKETAKWAYFLSIMGFILIALLVLLALLMGTLFAKLVDLGGGVAALGARSGGLIMTIYLLFALIYFFPVYYLYQFASKIKAAFTTDNNEQLNTSFEYLKSHYKFLGIFTLVVTIIYALILVLGIIGGIMSAM